MLPARQGLSHWAAPGRAITMMSMAGKPVLWRRNDSLTRRLIRLRCTADLETFFETARPRRAVGPGPGAAMTVKHESLRRRPDLNTRVYSAGESRRCARVKPCERADSAGSLTAVPANRTSDRESGTPLGAPARQHLPAILGGHAGAETMGPFPAQIARLVGAFHRSGFRRGVPEADPPGACQKTGNRTRATWVCQYAGPLPGVRRPCG